MAWAAGARQTNHFLQNFRKIYIWFLSFDSCTVNYTHFFSSTVCVSFGTMMMSVSGCCVWMRILGGSCFHLYLNFLEGEGIFVYRGDEIGNRLRGYERMNIKSLLSFKPWPFLCVVMSSDELIYNPPIESCLLLYDCGVRFVGCCGDI